MADSSEGRFNVSISTVPASQADFAGRENGTLLVHMAINETVGGDSRSFAEYKAVYHRVTKDTAKSLFDALAPLLDVKKDLTLEQIGDIKGKVLSALATLDHTQVS